MTSLTPQDLIFADILRFLQQAKGGPPMMHAAVAVATGRDKSNLRRDLGKLAEAGQVSGDNTAGWILMPAGEAVLEAIDRAEGKAVVASLPVWPLAGIEYNPDNPRKSVAQEKLEGLADTIASAEGLLQPIVLYPVGASGARMLHAGERRVRACRLLEAEGRLPAALAKGLPFIEREASKAEALFIGLVENSQREGLTPFEDAKGLKAFADETGLSARAIAFKLGRAREGSEEGVRDVQEKIAVLKKAKPEKLLEVEEGRQSFDWLKRSIRKSIDEVAEQLRPIDLMMLAEVKHKSRTQPRNRHYYSGETECSYLAGKDPVLKGLTTQGILRFTEQSYEDHKAYIATGHSAHTVLSTEELEGLDLDEAGALKVVHALRVAAVGEEKANAARKEKRFVTEWLNGPFELSAKAAAKVAEAKANKAEIKEKSKAQKAALEKRMFEVTSIGMLAQTNITAPHPTSPAGLAAEAIRQAFSSVKIALPVKSAGRSIVDANDDTIIPNLSWRFYEKEPLAVELLVIALNAAFAFPIGRDEFTRWIRNRLVICGLDQALADQRAPRALADFLAESDLDFHDPHALWREAEAHQIADAWFDRHGEGLPEDDYLAWAGLFLQSLGWTAAEAPAIAAKALKAELEAFGVLFGDADYSWDKHDARRLAQDYFAGLHESKRPDLPQDKTPVVILLSDGNFSVPPEHWDDPDPWIARHVRGGQLLSPREVLAAGEVGEATHAAA